MVLAIGSNIIAGNGSSNIDILTLLESIYPIGAIYITVLDSCPIQELGIGVWEKVAEDRVLQGAGTRGTVGNTLEAGLPNITGTVGGGMGASVYSTGAFVYGGNDPNNNFGGNSSWNNSAYSTFDASRSSSIYGNSTTVQQDAFLVNIFKRIS